MRDDELRQLKKALVALAGYYQRPISDEAVVMYAADLEDLPYAQVIEAMRAMRLEPGRRQLPMPADIRAYMAPLAAAPRAQGCDIAGRIVAAISGCGYTNAARARERVGAVGWRVVEQLGGWAHLCQTLTTAQTGTFYAQARDLAAAHLEAAAHQARRQTLAPAVQRHALEEFSGEAYKGG